MSADRLLKAYFLLKERLKEVNDTYKEERAVIEGKMEVVRNGLDKIMSQAGTDQLKSAGVGMCFPEIKQKIQVDSAADLRDFVVAQIKGGNDDAIMLLNAAANQVNCRQHLEDYNELPEGVSIHQERVIVIRKSK